MLFLDRYWWLRPMLAVAIVLVFSVPLIVLAGDTHYFELIAQGKASFSTGDISNAILVVTYLVLAIGLFISTLPARRRGIQRVAAIQGDLDCIPQANIQAMSGEVTQERIVIQQLLPKRLRWMFFLASIPLLLLVLALICLLAAYEFGEISSYGSADPFLTSDILFAIFGMIVAVLYVISVVWWVRYLPTALGKPFGAVLDENSVSGRSRLNRKTTLRWEDVRLFEVTASEIFGHVITPCVYRLWGTQDMITWEETSGSQNALPAPANTPDGSAIAVGLIHARTGLQPRTFVKPLQAKEQPNIESG